MTHEERRDMARDLSEMVRLGALIAYIDEAGILRFVPTYQATSKQLSVCLTPWEVSKMIQSSECEQEYMLVLLDISQDEQEKNG